MTDSGTKCALVIHESKAHFVQILVHNNRLCLHVPRVPGSFKNLHNSRRIKCKPVELELSTPMVVLVVAVTCIRYG